VGIGVLVLVTLGVGEIDEVGVGPRKSLTGGTMVANVMSSITTQ
jgi:hypothetical protein